MENHFSDPLGAPGGLYSGVSFTEDRSPQRVDFFPYLGRGGSERDLEVAAPDVKYPLP